LTQRSEAAAERSSWDGQHRGGLHLIPCRLGQRPLDEPALTVVHYLVQIHGLVSTEASVCEDSPHARIDCMECHVGDGAQSFVRAKLRGPRQMVAAMPGSFSRGMIGAMV
jgi:hypothetical protein